MCLLCFSSNLLRTRSDVETTRMWTSAIHRLLKLYAVNNDVRAALTLQCPS